MTVADKISHAQAILQSWGYDLNRAEETGPPAAEIVVHPHDLAVVLAAWTFPTFAASIEVWGLPTRIDTNVARGTCRVIQESRRRWWLKGRA